MFLRGCVPRCVRSRCVFGLRECMRVQTFLTIRVRARCVTTHVVFFVLFLSVVFLDLFFVVFVIFVVFCYFLLFFVHF